MRREKASAENIAANDKNNVKLRVNNEICLLFLILFLFYGSFSLFALDRYVVPGGAGSKNGIDWDNAYSNIQDAVTDCSGVGDRIFLKVGTYIISSQITIVNRPGLLIRGGMAGNTPLPGDSDVNPSILSRNTAVSTRIFYITKSTVTVERVKVYNGYLGGSGNDGGGIYAESNSYLTVTNCVFDNNRLHSQWGQEGGGIYIRGGRLRINDSFFLTNILTKIDWTVSSHGGAVAVINSDYEIRGTVFRGNYVWARHYDIWSGPVLADRYSELNCYNYLLAYLFLKVNW